MKGELRVHCIEMEISLKCVLIAEKGQWIAVTYSGPVQYP